MKGTTQKYTILYARLSQEDESFGESNSIQNQKMLLQKYAEEHGFENIVIKSDDGYSGTTFIRPAWIEIMNLIEINQVSTLIVKDMSRLGREYLQVGKLMEIDFPTYGVRFIAINDGVDSAKGDNEFTPFKNIINEWYAKDCSKKIKAVIKSKAERGERVSGRAPYGYMNNPDIKKIVPNPDTADNVKLIFKLCMDGCGPKIIANKLEEMQILTPSNYYYSITNVKLTNIDIEHPYHWSSKTVAQVLDNEVYIGNTINLKYTTLSYKNKKHIVKPEDEWVKFENTHEPLVSKDTWEICQNVRKNRKRPAKGELIPNMFSGMVFCNDCKKPLSFTRENKTGNCYFVCATNRKYGSKECTPHRISEKHLKTMLLDEIKRVTHFARQDEEKFVKFIIDKSNAETKKELSKLHKQVSKLEKRDNELLVLFKKTYEDNVLGKISDEQFQMLSTCYNQEQKEIKTSLPDLKEQIVKLENTMQDTEKFISKAKKYTNINELTSEILRTFIDKIIVEERPEKSKRNAVQDVWIYYRDIGLVGQPQKNIIQIAKEKHKQLKIAV
ncbi:MAG: recombinase family protein [Clostridia bacterium]